MTDNNTQPEAEQPTVTNLLDERIKDAQEDLAKVQAKLDKLLTERANRDRIENLAAGTAIRFEYGRGDKRRELNGTVVATGDDPKMGRMLAVQVGEGLDVQTYKIRATDVLFDDSEADDMSEVVS